MLNRRPVKLFLCIIIVLGQNIFKNKKAILIHSLCLVQEEYFLPILQSFLVILAIHLLQTHIIEWIF